MMDWIRNYIDDVFYWLGAILISAGAYFIFPVAAFFSAGIFCLVFGFLIGKARVNQ